MCNYLSSTTQLAPLRLASAATTLPGVLDTTLILTPTYDQQNNISYLNDFMHIAIILIIWRCFILESKTRSLRFSFTCLEFFTFLTSLSSNLTLNIFFSLSMWTSFHLFNTTVTISSILYHSWNFWIQNKVLQVLLLIYCFKYLQFSHGVYKMFPKAWRYGALWLIIYK